MEFKHTQFAGLDCVQVKNGALSLWITHAVGPRIIGLSVGAGSNLLAVLPDATTITPTGKLYRFHGGHRLWRGPEDLELTYVPDDKPVTVSNVSAFGLAFAQPPEQLSGIQKRMTVTLPDDTATVVIDHEISNQGNELAELAPWAITQLRPGGFGILPMSQAATGLLPNRRLTLWPYTQMNSSHIEWGDRYVFVHANMLDNKLKIGWANPDGWLGYWIDDILFVKQAAFQDGADYVDYGSSTECYCDPRFLELETLGPRTTLEPGESVSHRETWRLFECAGLNAEESAVRHRLRQLGVES